MSSMSVIIIDKNASLKSLVIKDFKIEELYKKCGFKKSSDFIVQSEWKINVNEQKYKVQLYAKTSGRHNNVNQYDFPPPIESTLFFGNCLLLASVKKNIEYKHSNLSLDIWNTIYNKLFGGFEDLNDTVEQDEQEIDELHDIPQHLKTKDGYLKDDFVVDSGSEFEDFGSELNEDSYESENDVL